MIVIRLAKVLSGSETVGGYGNFVMATPCDLDHYSRNVGHNGFGKAHSV